MLIAFEPERLTELPLMIGPCFGGLVRLCPRRTVAVGMLPAYGIVLVVLRPREPVGTELTLAVTFGFRLSFGLAS
jgi:hypothetical protein